MLVVIRKNLLWVRKF